MNMMCKKNDYVLSKNGVEKVKAIIAYGVAHKGEEFANGRLVRNLYEDMVMNHARRVNGIDKPSREDLMELKADDIPSVAEKED